MHPLQGGACCALFAPPPHHPKSKESSRCRDVFNEKPTLEEVGAAVEGAGGAEEVEVLPRGAVIHTTKGDVSIKMFPDECPKTVENFTTHARNGYYDGIIFHRVIKGFMLQTGDPLGARPPAPART